MIEIKQAAADRTKNRQGPSIQFFSRDLFIRDHPLIRSRCLYHDPFGLADHSMRHIIYEPVSQFLGDDLPQDEGGANSQGTIEDGLEIH